MTLSLATRLRTTASIARTSRTLTTTARISTPTLSRTTLPARASPPTLLTTRTFTTKMSKSKAAASHGDFNRNSLFDLKGRIALVTGGASGIGLMITQALAANGAKVYIVGRNADKLNTVVNIYNKDIDGEIIALQGDVTSKDEVARLVKEIESREKCLCILVNNVGVSSETVQPESESATEMKQNLFDTSKTNPEDWVATYKSNVISLYFMTAGFLPLLQKSSERHPHWSGTVVNITSISGQVKGAQHHFAYNAAKAAAGHLTRMIAAEIAAAGHKIRVNALSPGVFPSEMTTGSDEYQKSHLDKEKYEGKVPAGRPGRDIDMAQGILGLVCNQYIGGQTLVVDGGYMLSLGQ